MSDTYDSYPPVTPAYGGTTDSQPSGTADVAKDQASHLKDSATDAGKQVAGTAKDQAKNVASEAKSQAKDLLGQTKGQLSEQAGTQQKRVAGGIRSLGDELSSMAEKSEKSGPATDLVHQVASRAGGIADWLDDRDPSSLLDEVSRFARQRPGTFIAIAAVAGLVAGRLTRSIVSEAKDAHDASTTTPSTGYTGTSSTYSSDSAADLYTAGAAGASGYSTTDNFGASGDYLGSGSTTSNDPPLTEPLIDEPPLSVGNEPYRSDTQP